MADVVRSGPSLGGRRAASIVVAAVVVGVAAAILWTGAADRGPGGVYRIHLVDRLDLYADPEVRPSASLAAAVALIVVAGMAATAARFADRIDGDLRCRRFFLVSGVGAAFLGLDALLGIHESIGLTVVHWVPAAPRPARVGHLVLAVYALAASLFFWSHRDLLRRSPRAVRWLGVAVCSSVIVSTLDVVVDDPPRLVTHPLQAIAAVGLVVGYWSLVDRLAIGPRR